MFLPLIENLFKHGTYLIRFDISSACIQLRVSNKIREVQGEMLGGVGLQNLQRRLDLLYPKNHKLNFSKTKESYTASLTLNLHPKP